MTGALVFGGYVAVILGTVIGVAVWGADRKYARAIVCAVLLVVAVLGGITHLIATTDDQYTDYANRCRGAGGAPIRAGNSSLNCVDGSGRYLDVQW